MGVQGLRHQAENVDPEWDGDSTSLCVYADTHTCSLSQVTKGRHARVTH